MDTVLIAFVATVLGAVGAFFLSFPAARNMGAGRVAPQVTRRFLELLRTVPELVFALFFVFAFGPGPMAGILATTLHTVGVLGKLFSEINKSPGSPHQTRQVPQQDRDHVAAREGLATGRYPLRQMSQGLPLRRCPRRNHHVLAMTPEQVLILR